MSEDNQYFK